jgi:hypothetical protein
VTHLSVGFVAALLSAVAVAAEPPVLEGLTCTVISQGVMDGMRLEISFSNETGTEVALAPGPHLVFYRDPEADDAMGTTARVDRIQRTPLVVPAASRRVAFYGMDAGLTEAMRCNGRKPAAAALFFYQHNQRPQFRCMLRQFDVNLLSMRSDCPGGEPFAAERRAP